MRACLISLWICLVSKIQVLDYLNLFQMNGAVENASTRTATKEGDGEARVWEHAWTIDEMRKGATSWTLASDAGVILH